jgi:hypothetical protein
MAATFGKEPSCMLASLPKEMMTAHQEDWRLTRLLSSCSMSENFCFSLKGSRNLAPTPWAKPVCYTVSPVSTCTTWTVRAQGVPIRSS